MNAGETDETFHQESGMRYQVSSSPILSTNLGFSLPLYPHSYPQRCATDKRLTGSVGVLALTSGQDHEYTAQRSEGS